MIMIVGRTPATGHLGSCEFPIEQGADVNFTLPDTGETLLHAALCKTDPRFEHLRPRPVLRLLSYGNFRVRA